MVLALQWYRGGKVKYGLLSKHLFQRKLQYGRLQNLKVTTNFYKKHWLPVIKWNEKRSLKQVVSITCTSITKSFSATITSAGLWVVSFETEEKNLQWSLVCMSFHCIFREETTKQILCMRSKCNFLYADI